MHHRPLSPGSSSQSESEASPACDSREAADSARVRIRRDWAERHFAVTRLAYDARQVRKLPRDCATWFRGVGNPHRVGPIVSGERVLDHCCGSGFDLLLAALRFGRQGAGVGVEQNSELLECARRSAERVLGGARLSWRLGSATSLPVASHSVDVVVSNGAVGGRSPRVALREIVRVLRPGGRLHLAVRVGSCPTPVLAGEQGPCLAEPVEPLLLGVGFVRVQLVERFCLSLDARDVGESFLAYV